MSASLEKLHIHYKLKTIHNSMLHARVII